MAMIFLFLPALSRIETRNKNTAPTFCKRGRSFVSPSHSGLREREGLTLRKNAPVHNRRGGLRCGKNPQRFGGCPSIAPGGLRRPLGLWLFMQSRSYRYCSHLFQKRREFCVPIPFGIAGKRGTGPPQNTPGHNRKGGPCRRKNLRRIAGYLALAPGGLRKSLALGLSMQSRI